MEQLVSCRLCGKQVANTAMACPQCGVPYPCEARYFETHKVMLVVGLTIALLSGVLAIFLMRG